MVMGASRSPPGTTMLLLTIGAFAPVVVAHGNHDESHIPEGQTVSADPIVSAFGLPYVRR